MNQEITVNNQVYVAHPEPDCSDICSGCAFDKDEEGCNIASNMQNMCGREMIIWKKKEEPMKEDYFVEEEPVVGEEYNVKIYGKVSRAKLVSIADDGDEYLVVCGYKNNVSYWVNKKSFQLNKKVNWTKVPIDTKIIVEGIGKRYFAGVSSQDNVIKYFGAGATSWSADKLNVCSMYVDYVKLA